jgi:hydrocephalus-inducing protein
VIAFGDIHNNNSSNWWQCSSPCVRVRLVGDITGQPEGFVEVEYRPLLHHVPERIEEATLSLKSAQLGEYRYKLQLSTSPAGVERMLYFRVPLGRSQTQAFRFTSYNSAKTALDLKCIVQQPACFSVPALVKAEPSGWDGVEQTVMIKFEPEALGEFRDTLVMSSDSCGEYKCTLQGQSIPPLPQGPYVFQSTQDIEFKNVFNLARDFHFTVDHPGFSVSAKVVTIPAKSGKVVTVKVEKVDGASKPFTGKLLVTCPALDAMPPWVYYLEASE